MNRRERFIQAICLLAFVLALSVCHGDANIALNKQVIYSVSPDGPIDDAKLGSRLTDGLITTEKDADWRVDRVVGWQDAGCFISDQIGVNMVIDLGSVQRLKKLKYSPAEHSGCRNLVESP